jgi:cytochrome c553
LKRGQRIALVLLALAAAAVLWLLRGSRQPPLLPADPAHAAWEGAASCETCHGPDGIAPKSKKHPLGFDCLRCHGSR